jgi:hypothetical protein
LKNLNRDALLDFIETALSLHPHLRELLIVDGAPTEPPSPANMEDIPWCHCGHCRQMPRPEEQLCCRRTHGNCLLETAARDINDVVLRRSVILVAVRDMNGVFAYNNQMTISAMQLIDNLFYGGMNVWEVAIGLSYPVVLCGQ